MQGESKSKHICAHKNCNFTFYHCNAESWITKWDCPFLLHRGFIISPILLTFNMPWGCKRERREKDVALVSRKGFCFLNHISLCSRSLSLSLLSGWQVPYHPVRCAKTEWASVKTRRSQRTLRWWTQTCRREKDRRKERETDKGWLERVVDDLNGWGLVLTCCAHQHPWTPFHLHLCEGWTQRSSTLRLPLFLSPFWLCTVTSILMNSTIEREQEEKWKWMLLLKIQLSKNNTFGFSLQSNASTQEPWHLNCKRLLNIACANATVGQINSVPEQVLPPSC